MPMDRCCARALGLQPGILPPGPLNAITDVAGVLVGHFTFIEGEDIRTGATAILPHPGNLLQEKVPAGLAVGNGFGKLMGSTQIEELGEIETPRRNLSKGKITLVLYFPNRLYRVYFDFGRGN